MVATQIGFKTVQDLISLARQYITEAAAAFWGDDVLLTHANDEQLFLMQRILQAAPDYFDVTQSISLAVDTAEYDLPLGYMETNYVEYASSGDLNEDRVILPVLHQQKRYIPSNTADINLSLRRTKYYLRRDKIGFTPTPAQARTVTHHYSRRLVPLHYGTATAGAASTITFPSTPTVGNVSNIDDFYNYETIYIVSGTGAGQIREISDYAGSTRVATVGTAWTTQPDSTSVYSLISEIPSEHHPILAVGTAIRALAKAAHKELPSSLTDLYNTMLETMIHTLEERQVQEPRFVNYTQYAEDD